MSFGFGVGDFIAVLDKAKLYRERFADAPDHFDSLGREIASLTSILEYIGRIEDQLTKNEKEALAAPIKESTKLLGELEIIYNDNTSLEKHEGTSTLSKLKPRAVWRRLRMKPEDVQKLRQRITMNVHFLSAIKGFRDSEAIHTTKQVVTSIHDEQTSRQEREILDWLTATDYAPQQRDHLSRRYRGTNQWLLDSDEYKSWVSRQNQTIICPGMPGAGKTIMASVVVDDLFHRYQDSSDVGIAYIYCNFKDQERQNHYDMLSSIAKQLAQCRSPIPSSLKELYNMHQRKKTSRTLEETTGVLQAVASSYHRVFIVIDALDECESKSRQALMTEVARLQKRHPTNVLATAREIPEIIESFNLECASTLRIQASDVDVSRYISSRIPDMQSFVQRRPEIQEEIREGVLCRINGMFLLAKLLIDSLSCKISLQAVRKALAAASAEDDTYAYFYDEALERIRVQPPTHVQLANQVLSWIAFAKRPLEMHELQHALAVEEDEPDIEEDNIPSADIIISACAGLVTLDEQGGVVRLVHQTTQEFFNKRNENLFPDADAEIANTCVRYLVIGQVQRIIRSRTRDIPFWRKPYYFESSALKDLRKSDFPFCEYAVLYWGHHAGKRDKLPANTGELLKNRELLEGIAIILSEHVGEDVPSAGAHLAAWFGLRQVFNQRLLPEDDVAFVDRMGRSILSWAARQGHYELIESILDNDILRLERCQHKPKLESFQLALFNAVKHKHSQVARRLIRFSDENLNFEIANDPSLLDMCIEQRDITMSRLLLERPRLRPPSMQDLTPDHGIKVENMHESHNRSLLLAAARGFDEVVNILLDHGANVEQCDRAGRSPLLRAFQSGHPYTIKMLLQNGAKFLGQSGKSSALWPTEHQELIVESLIHGGANIDSENEIGMTLLASAAKDGQNSMLVVLLNHKANIEATDHLGRTPLWHALENEQESILGVLLKRGARTETMNRNGDTPLLYATKRGMISILEMLLSFGAQTEAQDSRGRTPLLCAIGFNEGPAWDIPIRLNATIEIPGSVDNALNEDIVAARSISCVMTLAKHGANINCRDNNNMTPIMSAAESGDRRMLEKLTELGADLAGYDKFGRTALLIAAGAGRDSVLSTDDLKRKLEWEKWRDRKKYLTSIAWVRRAILRNTIICQQLMSVRDHHERTPLWWAITSGKTGLLKDLSKMVDEVEVFDKRGRPPLMDGSADGANARVVVQLLLEHVSQFGSDGERFMPHKGITDRAISYVRFFLDFNGIDTNTAFNGELRDLWLCIKPGDFIPPRTSYELSSDFSDDFSFNVLFGRTLDRLEGLRMVDQASVLRQVKQLSEAVLGWEELDRTQQDRC